MRILIAGLLACLSFGAHAAGMGYDDARHLLLRTGFAPREEEVQAYARLTRAQAVDKLLAESQSTAQIPAPDWVNEPLLPRRKFKELSAEEKKALQRQQFERGVALRA